ncbi:dehydration-responsive element-binding protein 1F-like [Magnolia sinica]|uniref:dehydration-responsive element-binding protein 1F-like n=1 Tax=Magnolia sinica TaxID=86752 RepID=UPI0026599360|nr:dehydration-responsive element-binding protein 1F-like [Magnolia sinica]
MDVENESSSNSNDLPPSLVRSSGSSSSHMPSPATTHKRKAGRKKFRETRHPVYRGVRQRNGDKWVCEVRDPHTKSRIWLGTFPCPKMAARAYDVAALALRGDSVPLNFPDSMWALPRAQSSSAKDIQTAAIAAAEAFRPSESMSSTNIPILHSPPEPTAVFVDEEAMFNVPGHLANMAEGLLLMPPAMQKGFDCDDVDCHVDLSLWSD